MSRVSTRADDLRVLSWLGRRASGVSSAAIAAADGVRPEAVRVATSRVMAADLAESGEPEAVIRAYYWDTRGAA